MSEPDPPYAVGRGKPPKHGQIRPGERRNPHGRPRGSKNLSSILLKVAAERVPYTEGNKRGTITKLEAAVKHIFMQALTGDLKALAMVLDLMERAGRVADPAAPVDASARKAADMEILKGLRAQLNHLVKEGGDGSEG
jgi:hypothetical protein